MIDRDDSIIRCEGCGRRFIGLTTIGGILHALRCADFRGFTLIDRGRSR